jgi:hypothetical protein
MREIELIQIDAQLKKRQWLKPKPKPTPSLSLVPDGGGGRESARSERHVMVNEVTNDLRVIWRMRRSMGQ